MGVSTTHIQLVNAMVDWVVQNRSIDDSALMLVDLPDCPAHSKPGSIKGYIPDLYIAGNNRLIGEAKTRYDIETRHSREQYIAYISHLKLYENSTFLIAVPWFCVPQIKSIITKTQKDLGAFSVSTIFLEKLPG